MYPRLLKSRSAFLAGFAIGFVLALLLLLAQDVYVSVSTSGRTSRHVQTVRKKIYPEIQISDVGSIDEEIVLQYWSRGEESGDANVTYLDWLKRQGWKVKNLDMDEYLYAPKKMEDQDRKDSNKKLESDWLMTHVRITCVVFVKRVKLAKSVKNTWGKRCSSLYFFGQNVKDPDVPVLNVPVKLMSSWQLLCEVMNHVWREESRLQWIIFVKDDTVVIPENLRYMVAPLNYTQDHYLGHAVVMWGQSYNVAQAGYVLSAGALRKMVQKFNNSESCAAGGKYWKKEDYYLAKHLSSIGVHPSDTRDQYLRGTFHGYSLQNLLWGIMRPGSYWTRALYPTQEKCCSPRSVTFSSGESDKMYTLDYVLYHLHVLRSTGVFGAQGAPTPIPEEDVWRIALKEEFNITYTSEISSETYYEIWHAKYSEPEQLIKKNYQSMPDVLSSILTAYELESRSLDKSAKD